MVLAPPFLGPGFRLADRWNRLVETVKTRKKTRKNGGKMGEIQPEKCEERELTKINWQIGVYGYYLANASENTISGGFISGGPNNMTVIRSVGKSSRNQTLVQFSSRHWFVVVAWPRR